MNSTRRGSYIYTEPFKARGAVARAALTAAHVAQLAVKVSLSGLLYLSILFLLNVTVLFGDGFLATHPGVLHVLTIFVRAAFPIVIGAIGISLWNAGRE